MSEISPVVASHIARAVYLIKDDPVRKLSINGKVDKHFSFDPSQCVKGTTGGYFWRQKSGFVLIGKGRSQRYKNDHVIAIRGSAIAADWVTNFTCKSTASDTGTTVHTGFQRTFSSFRSGLERYLLKHASKADSTIHCVGHSLGGALATLAANWISNHPGIKGKVYLYTYGCPRVGLKDFAISASSRIDKIFRCVHGADPVPKAPVWPYFHAPYNGTEYLLNNAQGFSVSAHYMPEYIKTSNRNSWAELSSQRTANLHQRVVLNYQHRLQVTYSTHWADKLSAALMTVLIDGGCAATVAAFQSVGASVGTLYDQLAKTLSGVVNISQALADQVKGLLGHMLVFAGKGANLAIELTEKFIRWVFKVTIGRLNSAVRQALKAV